MTGAACAFPRLLAYRGLGILITREENSGYKNPAVGRGIYDNHISKQEL